MKQKQKNNYMIWIFRNIRRRIPAIAFQMILCVLVSYANIQFALTTKIVVNNAISGDMEALKLSALVMIGLCLFRLAGSTLNQFLTVNIREALERDFKRTILRKILRCEYSEISHYHSGDLIQRMDSDASSVYSGVLAITGSISGLAASLVTAFLALLEIAPGFTWAFAAAAAVISAFSLLLRQLMKQMHRQASAAEGVVKGFFHESISKLMLIQALDVSEEMERRTDRMLDDRWKIRRKQRNLTILSGLGTSVLTYTSYLVTMLWCAAKLVAGQITFGDVTAMTSLVSQIRTAATGLPHLLPQIYHITAACDRILEIEKLHDQPRPDVRDTRALYDDMTGFTAGHLTFAYDRDPVMRDVSLTIPKGGLTVIVGPSGIGKSTLLKLLLGLYRPGSGTLTIDTKTGSMPVSRAARSLFSYAPQGNFLLSGTLRENLTLTNPQADNELIRQALYVSAMDEYVASLPRGLETMLRENGAGLSEGQAQRLSLARAIISGAPVLLLDEVTSALDAATEKTVLERIRALPGKTCIAVTHRPAAMEMADRVIRVTEDGMTLTEA